MRILFVCTGNICRSPMAAALMKRRLAERGRTDIEVVSAGTAAADGAPASEGAYLIGLEKGLDISDHAATFLTREVVERADLIFAMGTHHVGRAEALGGDGRTFLLGEYAGRGFTEAEVEDPYGGSLDDYRHTYQQLDALLTDALDRLLREDDAHAGPGDD